MSIPKWNIFKRIGRLEDNGSFLVVGNVYETLNQKEIYSLKKQNQRYRKALENIVNIDGLFLDKPFNVAKALNLIDGMAQEALKEGSE